MWYGPDWANAEDRLRQEFAEREWKLMQEPGREHQQSLLNFVEGGERDAAKLM